MEKKFICYLCEPRSELRECKIEWHLSIMHDTQSSWKCSRCPFPGSKETILEHIRDTHDSKGKVVKSIRAKIDLNVPFIGSDSEISSSHDTEATLLGTKFNKSLQNLNNGFKKVKNSNLFNNHTLCQPLKVSNFSGTHLSNTSLNDENRFQLVTKPDNLLDSKLTSSSQHFKSSSLTTSTSLSSSVSPLVTSFALSNYPALSKKLEEERTSNIYFCIFCNNIETQFSPALSHYKQHLKFGFRCRNEKSFVTYSKSDIEKRCSKKHNKNKCQILDDLVQRPFVENWIIDFLNEQFLGARFAEDSDDEESADNEREEQAYVHCPICVIVTKYNNKLPVKYKSFREFERHFWIHCRWMRVDCIICGASTLRSKQREHLLSHDLQENCYHEYYMERNDKIIANLLQQIVDKVETLFDKRLAWTFGIHKNLLIVIDNIDLNYQSNTEFDSNIENTCFSAKVGSEYESETALRKAVELLGGKQEDVDAILSGTLREEFSDWQKEVNLKYDQYIQNQINYEKEKSKKKKFEDKGVGDDDKVDKYCDLNKDVKLNKAATWNNDDDSNDIEVVANLDLSNRVSSFPFCDIYNFVL